MNQPNSPRPPKWPFFLGDAALLAAAVVIGWLDTTPLSSGGLAAVVACVGLGAVLGVIPFLLDFAAQQREADIALRTRLEAENHKLNHAVELLTGTAAHLKSQQEAATRAVHAAETLPYRVQEKIGEFTAQLQQLEDDDKAALEKEIELLRETEGEKLGAVAEKIRAATKEFAALEKETRPALEAALAQSRELETALKNAAASARTSLLGAEAKVKSAETNARTALEAIETRLAAKLGELQQLDAALADRLAALQAALTATSRLAPRTPAAEAETAAPTAAAHAEPATRAPRRRHAAEPATPAGVAIPPSPAVEIPPATEITPEAAPGAGETAAPPAPALESTSGSTVEHPAPAVEVASSPSPTAPADSESVAPPATGAAAPATSPAPRVRTPVPKAERRAVGRLAAFPADGAGAGETTTDPDPSDGGATDESSAVAPKRETRRKSTLRSVDDTALPGFADHEIVYDDHLGVGAPTAAKTSDGTTRLLVTAYIGIGNKVFVRGDGPGLSWDKGVPLDFISIGKWSWQAAESAGPITVQLYKNDELKALGEPLVLDPGHHVEVRPVFREPDPF